MHVPSFLYVNPEHFESLLQAVAQILYGTLADIDGTYFLGVVELLTVEQTPFLGAK